MILRTIQGVSFRVISPSFYELAQAPEIDISYVGDQWMLHCPGEHGEPLLEMFSSLDEAVNLVVLGLSGAQRP